MPASEAYLVSRAGMVLPVEEHNSLLAEYLAAARAEDRPRRDNCRIVLSGVFCEQPPLNLIKAVELSGCYVVDDDFMLVNRWLLEEVPTSGDPVTQLAQAFLHHSEETAAKYQPDQKLKGKYLVDAVKNTRAEGVDLRRPELLRSRAAGAPDARVGAGSGGRPPHRLQVRGELRADAARPRAGRNLRRFHQALERAMTDRSQPPRPASATKEVAKEASMVMQKEMITKNYDRLTSTAESGKKVASTFVPGNLNELIMCFDMLNNLPELNAIQNGMKKLSGDYILEAEKRGHSEDVCTYVKADLGMMAKGNLAPNGKPLPSPDVLLLSYTGCFTFMKWFELLREQYKCPTAMLHVPYQGDGAPTQAMRDYIVKQLKDEVIPTLERVSGVKFDIDRLRGYLRESAKAEDDLVWALESAKLKPAPIDAYFGAVYYLGPIFGAFRGTPEATRYYRYLRAEIEERIRKGLGPITPEGDMKEQKYRLVVEGPPNWTSFREFWKMFSDEGAVVVASTYAKVGGIYDLGFRHDPDHPLESLADYCLGSTPTSTSRRASTCSASTSTSTRRTGC